MLLRTSMMIIVFQILVFDTLVYQVSKKLINYQSPWFYYIQKHRLVIKHRSVNSVGSQSQK